MKEYRIQHLPGKVLIILLGIVMIMSAFPVLQASQEANEYTTITLSENKAYKVGDTVTLEIRFYNKDTLVDTDDINITLGDPEWGSGRYIEVDENGSKIETGIYRVTFTIEKGDDPYDMGQIYGEARCTISTGRGEKSDSNQFQILLEQDLGPMLVVRVQADYTTFDAGDTVRFYVLFTYNGSLVDPNDPAASFQVNNEYKSINLTRESEGVYYYDYVSPEDGESKNLILGASGNYNNSYGNGQGQANLDYFQVWLHSETSTPTQLEGHVGVCDMEGTSMVLDVTLIYRYMNESWQDVVKYFNGTTGSDGLMNITLDFDDKDAYEFLDITIWANESSRGDLHQYAHTSFMPPIVREPEEGFDIISHDEPMFLSRDTEYTFNYTAYENGTILPGKEIFYYYYTSPWLASMGFGNDGEMGEVYHHGSSLTDENGTFSVTFTSPDTSTVIMDHFKADFDESRGSGHWKQVMIDVMYVEIDAFALDDLGFQWQDFGPGQRANITVSRDGQDGGWGGIHLHPFDPQALGFDSPTLGPMEVEERLRNPDTWEILGAWNFLNQHEFQAQPRFTGDEFTRNLGVPDFFPKDYDFLLLGGIFEDDGTQDGRQFMDYLILDSEGHDRLEQERRLQVHLDTLEILNSEQVIIGGITVSGSPPVEGANVTIEVTGAGSSNISQGVTDENGNLSFTLTADNVTGEDRVITIWINATKDGYNAGGYAKNVTVSAYIPPRDMVITTNLPDIMKSEQSIPLVVKIMDGDPLEGVYVTLYATGPGQTCKTNDITDENGHVMCGVTIDNVTGEDTILTVNISGTKSGYNKAFYTKVITIKAWKEPLPEKVMVITTDLPDSMGSEYIVPLEVQVADNVSLIAGANVTLQTSGPGESCKTSGVTNANGKVFCAITIYNVTGEDTMITIWINATKDGFQDAFYTKVILIEAWNPPLPVVILDPVVLQLTGNTSATVTAAVQGNTSVQVAAAVQPDTEDPDALGIYINVTLLGDGVLNWVLIEVAYDQVPAGIDPLKLKMYYWDDGLGTWEIVENSGVDIVNKVVWANVTHLTIFAPRQSDQDTTPPSIQHTPVTTSEDKSDITIRATVTDDGDGVETVTLFYRRVGETSYTSITMSGPDYKAVIPAEKVSTYGIEYYIRATDGTNVATHPADTAAPHTIVVTEKESSGGIIPGFGLILVLGAIFLGGIFYLRKRS